VFRDITPLLADRMAFGRSIDLLAGPFRRDRIDKVVAIEARGFVFGAPVASSLGVGFVPVRKPGKLPAATHRQEYALEYGTDTLEIHADALSTGERIIVVDDVLATGGTAAATAALVERCGATLVGFSFLIDLTFLRGRTQLAGHRVHSVIEY
jgi:adenine phosphoribosyltransferase